MWRARCCGQHLHSLASSGECSSLSFVRGGHALLLQRNPLVLPNGFRVCSRTSVPRRVSCGRSWWQPRVCSAPTEPELSSRARLRVKIAREMRGRVLARSAFRRERSRERHATGRPRLELPLCPYSLGSDAQPPVHFAAAHRHPLHVRSLHQAFTLSRIDPDEDTALTARADRHVPVDQERQAAEHPLLGEPALSTQQFAEPVCEVLIERHAMQTAPPSGSMRARLLSHAAARGAPPNPRGDAEQQQHPATDHERHWLPPSSRAPTASARPRCGCGSRQ